MSDGHHGHGEHRVYLDAVGAPPGVGHVMIAYYYKGRQAGGRELADATGELALDGWGGIAVLEYIPGDHDKMYIVFEGPIDGGVQGLYEVEQPRREPCRRVYTAVVFNPQVNVGQVQYSQCSRNWQE